jgi:tRNA1(Val) A37 N6-methylase TrmN6
MTAKLYGDALVFPNIENAILENNLYGVDINEESVEIARLALWLRTAKPHRKLNSLNDNIQCGNSLISDPAVAGDKAFDWEKEFPKVFEKGGFDVVIGNPPYGAKIDKTQILYLSQRYASWGISTALNDTYFIFYAMSLENIVAENGFLGFITPNTWKLIDNAKLFRKVLLSSQFQICQLIQHQNKVFEDATVDCDTLLIRKSSQSKDILIRFMNESSIMNEHQVSQTLLAEQDYINPFMTLKDYSLKARIISQSVLVKDELIIKNGVKPYEKGKGKPPQTDKIMTEKPFTSEVQKDASFTPLIAGSFFHKYILLWDNNYWIQYGEWLAAPREKEIFEAEEKLIFRQTSDSIIGTLIGNGFIMRDNTHIILNKANSKYNLKYVLTCLNSKLVNYFYWTINPEKGEAMAQVKAFHLGLLPIKAISLTDQQPFIDLADKMLAFNADLHASRRRFQNRLANNFNGIKITGALEQFDTLDFKQILAELHKQKITLSLKQQDEWAEYFGECAHECQTTVQHIDVADKAIDEAVYRLYGLTEEEIKVVEGEG